MRSLAIPPWLAALSLLLVPALAGAQDPPADTTAVTFRFGWPAGTKATVETMRVRARTLGEDGDTLDASIRYRMRVLSHPQGLRVDFDHFEFPEAPAGDRARQIQAILQALSSLSAGMIVSRDGELLHVDNLEPVRRGLDSLLVPILGPMAEAPPAVRRLVEQVLSESTLAAGAAQEWNSLVGSWLGAEFRPGHSYALSSSEPIPLLGGARVPMTYEFALVGRGPCVDGDSLAGCVMVTLDSYPDPDSMKVAVTDFLARMTAGAATGQFIFQTLDTGTHLSVVMDATTMLPHRMELTRAVEGTLRSPDGEEVAFQQVDLRRTVFSYGD